MSDGNATFTSAVGKKTPEKPVYKLLPNRNQIAFGRTGEALGKRSSRMWLLPFGSGKTS